VTGAANVLVIDGVTYLISFALVAVFVPKRAPAPAGDEEDSGGFLEGLRFLVREPLLRVCAGALLGNIASFRWLVPRIEGLRLIALSVPLQALPLWVLTLHVGAPAAFTALVVSGIGNGICNPSIHSIFTLRMPTAIRAKAMAAATTIWGLGTPIGLIFAGPVLAKFGPQPVLVGFAVVQTVAMSGVAVSCLRARAVPAPSPAQAGSR
jgi:hypothetical protein